MATNIFGVITGYSRSINHQRPWKASHPCLVYWGLCVCPEQAILTEQRQALKLLIRRASLALQDRRLQKSVFRSLEDLRPQVDMFQRLRAVGRYDSKTSLLEEALPPESDMAEWVRDALTHYWGGPKLTQNPLLNLQIVQTGFE